MKYIASIDVGSNAVRSSVAEVKGREFSIVFKERFPLRLGLEVFNNGKISSQLISEGIETFEAIAKSFQYYDLKSMCCVGTSALRNARNSQSFINSVFEESNILINTIDGKKESEIISHAVLSLMNIDKRTKFILDLGGGSLEIIIVRDRIVQKAKSFPIGTLRYLSLLNDSKKKLKNYIESIEREITSFIQDYSDEKIELIATGGNARRMGKLRRNFLGGKTSTHIKKKEMKYLIEDIKDLSIKDRIRLYDFRKDRADVILPAMKIFYKICKLTSCSEIKVPRITLIDGLFLEQI